MERDRRYPFSSDSTTMVQHQHSKIQDRQIVQYKKKMPVTPNMSSSTSTKAVMPIQIPKTMPIVVFQQSCFSQLSQNNVFWEILHAMGNTLPYTESHDDVVQRYRMLALTTTTFLPVTKWMKQVARYVCGQDRLEPKTVQNYNYELARYFRGLHNAVNVYLKKPPFTIIDYQNKYGINLKTGKKVGPTHTIPIQQIQEQQYRSKTKNTPPAPPNSPESSSSSTSYSSFSISDTSVSSPNSTNSNPQKSKPTRMNHSTNKNTKMPSATSTNQTRTSRQQPSSSSSFKSKPPRSPIPPPIPPRNTKPRSKNY